MIEAAKIWNEPNNKSHWDLQIDPDWVMFADLAIAAGKAIRDLVKAAGTGVSIRRFARFQIGQE